MSIIFYLKQAAHLSRYSWEKIYVSSKNTLSNFIYLNNKHSISAGVNILGRSVAKSVFPSS